MHNIVHEVKGDKLLITIDISERSLSEAPLSASGKTRLVASGSTRVVAVKGMSLSLNVMTK